MYISEAEFELGLAEAITTNRIEVFWPEGSDEPYYRLSAHECAKFGYSYPHAGTDNE